MNVNKPLMWMCIIFTIAVCARLWSQEAGSRAALQVSVVSNGSSTGRYDIYELTLTHSASYPNNWEDVAIHATFISPTGQTASVDGFFYDTNTWKLRFSPRELGTYAWSLTFAAPDGNFSTSGTFSCVSSAQSGFLRINQNNRYQLYTEGDGKYFFPIGFNDLPGSGGTNSLQWYLGADPAPIQACSSDLYFGTYAQQGKNNFFRWNGQGNLQLWTTGQVNVNGTGKNVYDIAHGKLADELAQTLHKYGMKYQIAFLANPLYLLPNWDMTNPGRWNSLKSLHHYVINRWGAYSDIWELMNEESGVPQAYYDSITQYIWSLDPYHHPITTSYVPSSPQANIEISSPHQYVNAANITLDKSLVAAIAGVKSKYPNIPMIMGEVGNQAPIPNYDPERYRMFLWTGFSNEASTIFWNTSYAKDPYNSGLTNMYIGTEERAFSTIFSNFISIFDSAARPVSISASATVRAYAMGSSQDVAAYIIQTTSHSTALSGATVTLNVPQSGMQGSWMDPKTGIVLQLFSPPSGSQTLAIPTFTADIVLRLQGGGTTPSPGTLTFSLAAYGVNEGAGTATITVTRNGGSSGAVSVSYATTGGTATAGSDYTAASGTLTWAAGDTAPKSFLVAIIDDKLVEGIETVNLSLSNPVGGASLGSIVNALLTITDNDVANRPPVISSAASASPNPVVQGQVIAFAVAASDPDADTLTYAWDFGDGATGSGASVNHVYASAGTFSATVTVSDSNAHSVAFSVDVTVAIVSTYVARINFQPASSPVPIGYQSDIGAAFSAMRGYGWNVNLSSNTRQRTRSSDPRVDTLVFTNGTATWTYNVADGNYLVSLASGDPLGYAGPNVKVVLQNNSVIDQAVPKGSLQILTLTDVPVTVSNGQLTISIGKGDGSYTMLNYIDIKNAAAGFTSAAQSAGLPESTRALTVQKLSGTVMFNAQQKDSATLSALLPALGPAQMSAGTTVRAWIGGEQATFVLDVMGRCDSSLGSISIRKSNGHAMLKLRIKSSAWTQPLEHSSFNPTANDSSRATLNAIIAVGETVYNAPVEVTCISKAHVGCKFHNKLQKP